MVFWGGWRTRDEPVYLTLTSISHQHVHRLNHHLTISPEMNLNIIPYTLVQTSLVETETKAKEGIPMQHLQRTANCNKGFYSHTEISSLISQISHKVPISDLST